MPPAGAASSTRPRLPKLMLASSSRGFRSIQRNRTAVVQSQTTRTVMSGAPWKRLVRFIAEDGEEHLGQPTDEALDVGLALADKQKVQAHLLSSNSPLDSNLSVTGTTKTIKELLSPISSRDAKVVHCVGLNYKDHAEECGLQIPEVPCLFIKTANSIGHPNGQILIPKMAQGELGMVDYEVELALVFSKAFKDISEEDAMSVVLGYTVANDVSARTHQFATPQWSFAKSFDGFCPLGPTLVHPSQIPDPHALKLSTTLNGKVMQSSSTSQLIFSLPKIISFISQGTTIEAGSVLITGTPPGIGNSREPKVFLKDGDELRCYMDGVGTLISTVKHE